MSDTDSGLVSTVTCIADGCDWKQSFNPHKASSEIAAKVDAELHWEDSHGGRVPEAATFGNSQCPNCLDMNGMDGTTSCGECGYIPDKVRA